MVLIAQVVAFLLFLLSFSTIESFEVGRNWWSQSVAHHSIISCLHACHLSVMFQFLSFIVPIEYPIWSLVLLYFILFYFPSQFQWSGKWMIQQYYGIWYICSFILEFVAFIVLVCCHVKLFSPAFCSPKLLQFSKWSVSFGIRSFDVCARCLVK